ncbi:MAG: type IV pilus assembly protein FimV [Methylococcales bacterium]
MTSNPISRHEGVEDPHREFFPDELEVCFQVPESGELNLDFQKHGSSTLEYLRYRVVRNPSDLLSHMRRILLQDKLDDSENLYAALIDLFIALGLKGESLRSRLLKQYRSKLSDARYTTLSQSLKRDTTSERSLYSCASVLTKGITGTCSLIRPVIDPVAEDHFRDPLQGARDYLEYSQIDEARQVLERAVLEHPERIDFQTELLQVYRAGRDLENFKKVYHELISSGNSLSDDWLAVSEFLSENA